VKSAFFKRFFFNAMRSTCAKNDLNSLIHKCVSSCHQLSSEFGGVRGISYQIKFSLHAAQCSNVQLWKKSYVKGKQRRERSSEFLSSVVSFYRTYFKALWHRKKNEPREMKENGNLRNCTIKKMNGWNEDMIYVEFIHTFRCMLCLMSLYYSDSNFFFFCFLFPHRIYVA
jgi:hypothetical protein